MRVQLLAAAPNACASLTSARGGQLAFAATSNHCCTGMVAGIRVQRQHVRQPVAARQEFPESLPAVPVSSQVLKSACRSPWLLRLRLHTAALATPRRCLLLACLWEEPAEVGGPAGDACSGDFLARLQ